MSDTADTKAAAKPKKKEPDRGTQCGFRYRIYPTEKQKRQIAITAGCVRYVYNRALAEHNADYEANKTHWHFATYSKAVSLWKKEEETAWLKNADAIALINAVRALDAAFTNFFKNPKFFEHPKPKKRSNTQSYRTAPNKKQAIAVGDDGKAHIYLPKLGWVKMVYHRPIEGTPMSISVKKTAAGNYYACIQCKHVPKNKLPKAKKSIGLDLDTRDTIVDSTGHHYENPSPYRKLEKKLAREQRRLSRKQKGSANYRKQCRKKAKLEEHIANVRRYHQQTLTTAIVRKNQTICVENPAVKDMMGNKYVAKHLADTGFYELLRQLQYKCEWYGRNFAQVDRDFPSSQLCSVCGHVKDDLKLSQAFWTCPKCGTRHDRDENAAVNILVEGLTGRWATEHADEIAERDAKAAKK